MRGGNGSLFYTGSYTSTAVEGELVTSPHTRNPGHHGIRGPGIRYRLLRHLH